MDVDVRKNGAYVNVVVTIDDVTKDLGLLDNREVIDLASQLASASSELLDCIK